MDGTPGLVSQTMLLIPIVWSFGTSQECVRNLVVPLRADYGLTLKDCSRKACKESSFGEANLSYNCRMSLVDMSSRGSAALQLYLEAFANASVFHVFFGETEQTGN